MRKLTPFSSDGRSLAMQSQIFKLENLEVHAAHACNLTCESCSHFSNSGHAGVVACDELRDWLTPWAGRLAPALFRIVGGEPTLNPELSEIVRMVRGLFPNVPVLDVVSNGFFLDRHPHLGQTLAECGASVHLSIHDDSPAYAGKSAAAVQILKEWAEQFGIRSTIQPTLKDWTRRHIGFGAGVLPYTDHNPGRSWSHCPAKYCRQIFEGQLWKCSPIAYLRLQKLAYPELSPAWDPYLAYRPLAADCSDEELGAFLNRREEECCGMCPAERQQFSKPDPLIPRPALKLRPKPPMISLCTSCMGRLGQLRQTLPENLKALQGENVEFVLVDYNSQDGLEEWVRSSGVLDDKRVVYVRERSAKTFHMSKAKNLAHFAAKGEILLNLDADNYIDLRLLNDMRNFFSEPSPGVVQFCNNGNYGSGTFGRIAINRSLFLTLGGYDESFWPMGNQDVDLIERAKACGARFQLVEEHVGAIENSKELSVALTGCPLPYQEMNKRNHEKMVANLNAKKLSVSREVVPVSVNFGAVQMI
jgi:glycosyl transferase family 2